MVCQSYLMKKLLSISLVLLAAVFFVGCGSPRKRAFDNVTKLEKEVSAQSDKPDSAKVIELTTAYREFAVRFAGDSLAPAYMLRAGGLFMNMGNPLKAIESLDELNEKYGTSPQAPQALFLEGFIFENMMGNTTKARELYSMFLTRFPKHDLADDAQVSLNNLGKTPEQLIHEFEAAAADSVNKTGK